MWRLRKLLSAYTNVLWYLSFGSSVLVFYRGLPALRGRERTASSSAIHLMPAAPTIIAGAEGNNARTAAASRAIR